MKKTDRHRVYVRVYVVMFRVASCGYGNLRGGWMTSDIAHGVFTRRRGAVAAMRKAKQEHPEIKYRVVTFDGEVPAR